MSERAWNGDDQQRPGQSNKPPHPRMHRKRSPHLPSHTPKM